MKSNRFLQVFALIVIAILFVTCNSNQSDTNSTNNDLINPEVIRVGAILPLTGQLASLGEKEARMLKFSQKIFNEYYSDQFKIDIELQDAQFKASLAANIAHKYNSSGINYITVSTTPLASAVLPITEKNNMLTIIHSMTNSLLDSTNYAIRIYPSISDEINCLGEWLKSQSVSKAFVLKLNSEWSDLWVNSFKGKYSEIELIVENYELNDLDIKNILSKVKKEKSNYIILLGYGNEYPIIIKQIKEMQIGSQIVGNIGFAYSGAKESAINMKIPDLLFDTYFPFMQINLESKEFIDLSKEYEKLFNKSILEEPGALYFYDSMALLLKAIKNKKITPEQIKKYWVNELLEYDGITGKIIFKKNGDIQVPLTMAKYNKDLEIVFINE